MARSTYYYCQPRTESAENLRLLRRLDELYLDYPFFGSRRMAIVLEINRKHSQRLMRILGKEDAYVCQRAVGGSCRQAEAVWRFERWRNGHKARLPIPEALWAAAVARRGPLCSGVGHHTDERIIMQALFLASKGSYSGIS